MRREACFTVGMEGRDNTKEREEERRRRCYRCSLNPGGKFPGNFKMVC